MTQHCFSEFKVDVTGISNADKDTLQEKITTQMYDHDLHDQIMSETSGRIESKETPHGIIT